MLWLPPIECGSVRLWFPLTDTALPTLLRAIGLEEERWREASFATLLDHDPFFLIWVAVRWPQADILRADSRSFGASLAQHTPRDFTPVPRGEAQFCGENGHANWTALLRAGRRRAALLCDSLSRIAAPTRSVPAPRLALLSLTHAVLAIAAETPWEPIQVGEAVRLPVELQLFLRSLPSVATSPAPERDVEVVRSILKFLGVTAMQTVGLEADYSAAWVSPTPQESPAATSPQNAEDLLVNGNCPWLTTPAWDHLIPELFQRLARLRELETDFQAQLQTAKLLAMRDFAYGASHEINNPLANISSRAQTLLLDEKDPERRKKLATINAQAFRAFEMIADAMLFAKPPQLDPRPVDLLACCERALRELTEDAVQQGTELRKGAWPATCTVQADEEYLLVTFKALLRNALEAVATDGWIEVEIEPQTASPLGMAEVEIRVTDNGPGVPEEIRPRIFDPFFSGRESGRGLGLGLAKCWRIVHLLAGKIWYESPAGGGARFVIRLPQPALVD